MCTRAFATTRRVRILYSQYITDANVKSLTDGVISELVFSMQVKDNLLVSTHHLLAGLH